MPFRVHNLWQTIFSVSTSCVCIFVPVSPDSCCYAISTHRVSFFCPKTASSACPSFPRVKHQILSSQHVPAPARTTPKYLQTYFIFLGSGTYRQPGPTILRRTRKFSNNFKTASRKKIPPRIPYKTNLVQKFQGAQHLATLVRFLGFSWNLVHTKDGEDFCTVKRDSFTK